MRFARALLALVLLLAWQSALLHPLQHVDDNGRLVHMLGHAGGTDGSSPRGADALCDGLAGLAVCIAGRGGPMPLPDAAAGVSFAASAGARTASAPPFLAQGPPALL